MSQLPRLDEALFTDDPDPNDLDDPDSTRRHSLLYGVTVSIFMHLLDFLFVSSLSGVSSGMSVSQDHCICLAGEFASPLITLPTCVASASI
jgi:hypothetical protein